jgi:Ca2+-transporting ATPase
LDLAKRGERLGHFHVRGKFKFFMPEFHSLKIEEVFKRLKSSKDGLTSAEVSKRIKKYGLNELPRAKPLSKIAIFISQFKSPLIYILLFAGLISFILRDWVDMGVIFGAVFINTLIGFFQENKANNALQKLKELIRHKAIVLRDNYEREVDSSELTQGDIIILKAGNRVPADGRLIEADNLLVNESVLTGESLPAEKNTNLHERGAPLPDRDNMVYASAIIVKGYGKAIVSAIGEETEIGKISLLVSATEEEKTPLQIRLLKFSNLLGIAISIAALLVVAVGYLQGRKLFDIFITGVALAVAAIPEGLTVAVTVALVLGTQRILKEKALVRKLIAAETLGSITVICTDKTGTLTEGKMSLAHVIIGEKEYEVKTPGSRQEKGEAAIVSLALQAAMMANDAIIENPADELADWKIFGAPTETALIKAAIEAGLNKKELLKIEPKVSELPFDNANKFMISLHKKRGGGFVLYEKGAPEKLLLKSSDFYHHGKKYKLTLKEKNKLEKVYQKLTAKGLRVMASAIRYFRENEIENIENIQWEQIDNNLLFLGFLALKDPLRQEAKKTIEVCRQAGIRPIIITGDHPLTARAIALEAGIGGKSESVLTGEQLDKISDEELKKAVKDITVYARVSPHHKLRIVRALQERGEVVAMTGDGINDAPALKAADIGISLGTAADIAKESSDLVLLDDNFKTIVSVVKEGRVIFSNIRKVVTYLIGDSFTALVLVIGSIILNLPLAILPVQILWVNIIQDGLPTFALAFEKRSVKAMMDKPIKKNEPILNKQMKLIIFGAGLARDGFILFLFLYFFNKNMEINYLRTLILALLVATSLFSLFSIRSINRPIWSINHFANPYLFGAVLASFILLLAAVYWQPLQKVLSTVSLNLNSWILIIAVAIASMAMIEIVKLYSFFADSRIKKI